MLIKKGFMSKNGQNGKPDQGHKGFDVYIQIYFEIQIQSWGLEYDMRSMVWPTFWDWVLCGYST
mgnify:CR=1 FL=1